jgi:N-acetylneuraminate synthase
MEFTEPQWEGLKRHAEEKGLLFLSSPFSLEAAKMLRRIGMKAWKVASGEIGNSPLIDYMVDSRLSMMVSTGMSPVEEIDATVARVQSAGTPLAVMQCTSAYPCPPQKVGLNMLANFRQRYGCAVGLSDHSGTIFPSLAAATLGAEVVEIHTTFSRECFGPDVVASVTTGELKTLVEGVRFIERMNAAAVDKNAAAHEMAPLRNLFTKSIVAQNDLSVGTLLTADNLALKKPGTGMPADRLSAMIGRRLRKPLAAGEALSEAHLEEAPVAQTRN